MNVKGFVFLRFIMTVGFLSTLFYRPYAIAQDALFAGPKAINIDVPAPVSLRGEPAIKAAEEVANGELQRMDEILYDSDGIVLSVGTNTRPVGALKLTSYRLEEIPLPQPWRAEVRGRETWVNKAWRLTITGGPFHIRAMPAVIWINDAILGYGRESTDLSTVSAVTFDDSIIVEGATIAISYGDQGPRTVLPERLTIGSGLR